ncbi:GLC7-interacting protein 2 [Cyberlindnera fabianii]|uniref:GLC7-interacting protein 2 n=1 Tax=Cyberlindnera fabianii TaxID=36022 RepID=A0A1V2L0F9_CYBFA|nr:GLC7-interacting protein 2 [Cyberlindnera fabianii]
MPTTPTYNKSVHFGNDVDVRYFDERERPTAISADASPILKARGVKAIFEVMDGGNVDLDDDEDSDDLDDLDDPLMITWKMEMTNFSKIKYNEKFNEGSKVFLEKLILDEDDNCFIRYTFDSWRTVIEIEANFTKEITRILKRSNYDRFTFKIPLSKFEMLNNDQTDISFCIRYRYGIEEVWDNNHHKNYHLRLYPSRKLDNNRSKKLNDYFSSNTSMDYFNNYQMLRSPETPNVLKNNESLLIHQSFGDLSDTFDISDSVNKLSHYTLIHQIQIYSNIKMIWSIQLHLFHHT